MTFTGVPPYDGYPDYDNRGGLVFGDDYSRAFFVSQERQGVVFEANGGFTLDRPVGVSLRVAPGAIYNDDGSGHELPPYDWAKDEWGALQYADPQVWKRRATWTVRRLDFNGGLDYDSPADRARGTFLPVVATQDAPNGWDVSLAPGDLTRCFQDNFDCIAYPQVLLYNSTAAAPGAATVGASFDAPYGLYSFTCAYVYTRTLYDYAGKPARTCELSFGAHVPSGIVRTGPAHFSITQDPDHPAPGDLSLASAGESAYRITGTGPKPGAGAPAPTRSFLDVLLTVDGVGTDPLYLGPKLYTLIISGPPPNEMPPLYTSPPGSPPLPWSDAASYLAARPDPYDAYTLLSSVSVLIPEDPPHGGARFRWQLRWPFYAGSYTIFFMPMSAFGPVHVYPYKDGDPTYFQEYLGAAFGGETMTVNPPAGARPFARVEGFGFVPPFAGRLDVTITPWGGAPAGSNPGPPGDGGDAAQDAATGRTTLVRALSSPAPAGSGAAPTMTLSAEAWEGWQSLAGTPPRPSAPILDAAGSPALGQYPSLWKDAERGRVSLCFQSPMGAVLRAVSADGLETLMPFPVLLFTKADGSPKTGGRPCHIQDPSTGIYYVAAAFTVLDSAGKPTGKEDILIARVDSADAVLAWADGAAQKTVVLGTAAAGRPALILSRYDPAQPLLLLHGDRKFLGSLGGEVWTEITS